MTDLKRSEISTIENFVAYPRGRGYVVEFSNSTFPEYFEDELGIQIYSEQFSDRGDSKRNRLISFLLQSDIVSTTKVLRDLLNLRDEAVQKFGGQEPDLLRPKFESLISSLEAGSGRPSLDAIYQFQADRTLDELIADLERTISANKPEVALDRLHTYCSKKFAYLLSLEGIECAPEEGLHARFGKYRKVILDNLELHAVSDLAMKSAISIFDRFNDVRNHWSLAHDNELLKHAEARYVFDAVCAILRFVKSIEAGRFEAHMKPATGA